MEDYDSLSLEQNHRLGIGHFNAQLGAGYTHILRGNQHGAFTLLRRGAGRIERYEDGHRGVNVRELAAAAMGLADRIEAAEQAGRPSPEVSFPKIA